MKKLTMALSTVLLLLAAALPAFASEGDPLANSVLLPGWLGAALVGLAIVLILVVWALSRRTAHK